MTHVYTPLQFAPTALTQTILVKLSRDERDALQVFLGNVAAVRKIKASFK